MPTVSTPSDGVGTPVLIIHSWWGLTRSFTRVADHLAEAGFVAGCVDLYAGTVAATEHEARVLRCREPKRADVSHAAAGA